jgi:hypothetical protein
MIDINVNKAHPHRLSYDDQIEISTALIIVGAEDGANQGQFGAIEVQGIIANAIMIEHFPDEEFRNIRGLIDKPVRISRRESNRLDLWCNGVYLDGGVRSLVHRTVRQLLERHMVAASSPKEASEPSVQLQGSTQKAPVFGLKPSNIIDKETRETLEAIHKITSNVEDYRWIALQVGEALKLGIVTQKLLKLALFIASEECRSDLIDRVNIELEKL